MLENVSSLIMYVCMYVCMCIHRCYPYVCMYVCMYVRRYIRRCYPYVCMYVYMYAYLYMYAYVYMYSLCECRVLEAYSVFLPFAVTYCITCVVWFSYGGTPVDYPDPQSDWAEFEAVLADKNDNPAEYPVSVRDPNEHPIRTRPWVDVAEVARVLEI